MAVPMLALQCRRWSSGSLPCKVSLPWTGHHLLVVLITMMTAMMMNAMMINTMIMIIVMMLTMMIMMMVIRRCKCSQLTEWGGRQVQLNLVGGSRCCPR